MFLFGLCSLAYGMMMGAVPTSVPMLILAGNWLLEGQFAKKWKALRRNRVFWAMASLLLIHLVGLLWTHDLQAGWDDIRIKAPLLSLPLVLFSSRALSRKELQFVIFCFLLGALTNTLWCIGYSFILHADENIRNASRFMSHIRLGLYLNMAILACFWLATALNPVWKKITFYLLALYFLWVLYLLGLASGMVNFILIVFCLLVISILRLPLLYKVLALLVLSGGGYLIWSYVDGIRDRQVRVNQTANNRQQARSLSGRPYYHDDTGQKENGNYIRINIQMEELRTGWKKIFPEDSFSYQPQHNTERFDILVRYLASKGLNKDSAGLAQLSAEDKMNIRKGIVNYEYPEWSYLHRRTYELVNELEEFTHRKQVNGHSLIMRLYFWNAGLAAVKQHPVLGVGTGDVQQIMNDMYRETDSPLSEAWYKRPHNQFLTITVALGVVGLLVFCLALLYPAIHLRGHLHWFYWLFLVTALFSFLAEDTLETQAGLTFFAFFQTLFVTQAWYQARQNATNS